MGGGSLTSVRHYDLSRYPSALLKRWNSIHGKNIAESVRHGSFMRSVHNFLRLAFVILTFFLMYFDAGMTWGLAHIDLSAPLIVGMFIHMICFMCVWEHYLEKYKKRAEAIDGAARSYLDCLDQLCWENGWKGGKDDEFSTLKNHARTLLEGNKADWKTAQTYFDADYTKRRREHFCRLFAICKQADLVEGTAEGFLQR